MENEGYIWVARDEDGELGIFEYKPVLTKSNITGVQFFSNEQGDVQKIRPYSILWKMFAGVTFRNSPKKIGLFSMIKTK